MFLIVRWVCALLLFCFYLLVGWLFYIDLLLLIVDAVWVFVLFGCFCLNIWVLTVIWLLCIWLLSVCGITVDFGLVCVVFVRDVWLFD